MTVRLNTLGRLQVFRGSEELTSYSLRGTRCALLLYIALEGRTTRDAAMAVVWPERSPEKARHSLSQTLYELRKDLGEDWLESTGEVLEAGDMESDAVRFGVAVEAEEYGDALSLYQGPFLEGTYLVESPEFQSWVDRRRSAIERMRRNAQCAEVEHRLGRDDLDGALAMTQSWVDYDPLDDEAQHSLIKLLAAAGRRYEALSQFEEFERTLRRDLEVSPLEETCRLIEQIRAGREEVLGAERPAAPLAAHADSSLVVTAGPPSIALERADRGPEVRELLEASLAGEFDIVRKLGNGVRADIFLAREIRLHRLVAIKVLRSARAENDTSTQRLVREAQATARISNPNVVSVFRTGVLENEQPYLVMEWIKGTSLANRLASGGQLGEARIRAIVTGIARGLAAAHAKGVVHRDVRPENVLLEEVTGRVALTDFGIAAILATGSEIPDKLTMSGELLSQPRYAALEQITGDGGSERSDIYSLGVIAFELLTGEHPLGATTVEEVLTTTPFDEPRRVLEVEPESDPSLADLVDRCLHRDAEHRPRAVDVVAELSGDGASVTLPPIEEPAPESEQLWAELRARRLPLVVAFFLLGSWGILFIGNDLVEAGVLGVAAYPLLLVTLVAGLQAALIRAWFHGKPGKHPTSPLERRLLVAVALVWMAFSLLAVVA
jgi:serine/threonine protein kinase/DNA-binding SARP family transcriptional activator